MEIYHRPEKPELIDLEEVLIPELQKIQTNDGFIAREKIVELSRRSHISESHIYGVASFYAQFRFFPPAKHIIRVCKGTACHVGGGEILGDAISRYLGIYPGERTTEGRFEFQQVACLGCCALAPVMQVDDQIFGQVPISDVEKILKTFK